MILTNRPDNVINVNSIISSLSDHNVIVNWDIVYNTPDPDMAWYNLQQILSETINRQTPLIIKCVKGKPAPGLTLMSKLR